MSYHTLVASVTVQFTLKIAGREMEASARVPAGPARVVDALPVLHGIAGAVVEAAEEGKRISCRAGCGACCRQLVPIAEAEARYLAALIQSLPEVRERFKAAVAALDAAGLGDRLRRLEQLAPAERQALGLEYFHLGVACPFLEDESCSIHPSRPMSCREYSVTSPVGNCRNPHPETIAMVPLPVKPSVLLFHFGDGKGEDRLRFLPLILALEWVAEHEDDPQTELEGSDLLLNFLRKLTVKRAQTESSGRTE
ncbi:MAG: YkgJ family cysteine cluster protein [Acidobacteria bacterium]|nr:YkgJ family cysteine cluster protein [Acidobacteriota bacterium]